MNKLSLYHYGRFVTEIETATSDIDLLKAVKKFKPNARAIEEEMFDAKKKLEVHHLGKTAD